MKFGYYNAGVEIPRRNVPFVKCHLKTVKCEQTMHVLFFHSLQNGMSNFMECSNRRWFKKVQLSEQYRKTLVGPWFTPYTCKVEHVRHKLWGTCNNRTMDPTRAFQ